MATPRMMEWNAATNGDIGQAFERASGLDDATDARRVLVSIVQAWTIHKRDGVILAIEGVEGQQHPMPNVLAIDFYGPFQTTDGAPCIQVQASLPASLERARHFFDPDDDDIVTMKCTKSAFDKIVAHLKKHVSTKENLIDIKSGGPLIQGYIVPLTM